MNIIITGGSGQLGQLLSSLLHDEGHNVVAFDLLPPKEKTALRYIERYIEGSLLSREQLSAAFTGMDAVIHIAALHGIHEFRASHSQVEFWDTNATGTFNVFQAAKEARVGSVINISSSSAEDALDSFYGTTKVVGEATASYFANTTEMNIVTLRPRAFIPHWDTSVYSSFVEWAQWFWRGAVHINDVVNAVGCALKYLDHNEKVPYLCATIDGAYEFTACDLEHWDKEGAGSTFKKYYPEHFDLAVKYGLDPALKPTKSNDTSAQKELGYHPAYSLRDLLEELKVYDKEQIRTMQ
jgi:UDP-glucose 4-epimerase